MFSTSSLNRQSTTLTICAICLQSCENLSAQYRPFRRAASTAYRDRCRRHRDCACCGEKHLEIDITAEGIYHARRCFRSVASHRHNQRLCLHTGYRHSGVDELLTTMRICVASVTNMSVTDVLDTVDRGDWQWNQNTHRYRNTATNTVITENTLIDLRDDLIESWRYRVQGFSGRSGNRQTHIQE